jgi:peptidoglycan/LPS O-acetylase OafA/YrhL
MNVAGTALRNRAAVPVRSQRLPQIEAARGIAAMAVFVHHLFQQFWAGQAASPFTALLGHLGAWGVTVFFALSGFCIHASRLAEMRRGSGFDRKRYLARRFFRIYPAFLVCLAVCLMLGQIRTSNLLPASDATSVLAHLSTLSEFLPAQRTSVNQVLWSVVVEVHFYLLYALLWRSFDGRSGVLRMCALAGLTGAATWILSVLAIEPGPLRVLVQHCFLATFWTWCLGALVAEASLGSNPVRAPVRAGWPLGALLLVSLLPLPPPASLAMERFALPVILASALFLLVHLPPTLGLWRGLAPLGAVSYSLYLLHPVAIWIALGTSMSPATATAPAAALGLFLATLSYLAFEVPFQRLGARVAP